MNDSSDTGGGSTPGSDLRPKPTAEISVRWITNLGYAILLVVMALLPSTSRFVDLSIPDWSAHGLAYGIQAGLIYWASLPSFGRCRAIVVGVLGASVFGVVTEGLQLLQPGRSVEVKDLASNFIGAVLIVGLVAVVDRFRDGTVR